MGTFIDTEKKLHLCFYDLLYFCFSPVTWCRHEMQHFVSVMQGYVVNQVIHVSWEEFQRELKTNVSFNTNSLT